MAGIKVANKQYRSEAFKAPESFNRENRRFEAVIASEEPVLQRRIDDGSLYWEILSCRPEHVDLSRLKSGAPLLDFHYAGGYRTQLGAVEQPTFENGKIVAQVQLSRRAELDDLVEDISSGIFKNLSAGYTVYRYEDVTPEGSQYRWLKAVNWRVNEASLAPVNADVNSKVRSATEENEFNEVEIINSTMATATDPQVEPATEPTPAPAPAPAPAPSPAPTPDPTPAPADTATERKRSMEIVGVVEALRAQGISLPADFAEQHISKGTSVDSVRALAITNLKNSSPLEKQGGQAPAAPGKITQDVIDKTRHLMEVGLSRKYGIKGTYSNEEIVGSEQYRNMHVLDLARNYMTDASGDANILRLDQQTLAKRALISSSSSDFAVILEGTARRKLLEDYSIAADTWRKIAVTGSVSDFREWSRLRGGAIGNLDKVNENGEFKNKPIPDGSAEKVKIETYGNTVNVTRQMLINDDLGYFLRIAGQMARASARSIEQALYDLINMNAGLGPVMSDDKTLIHADHGNTGVAGAYSAVTVAGARDKMKAQKDLSGLDWLDLRPDFILVPTALADTAISLNINEYTNESNKFQQRNIYKGLFSSIIDSPRLASATRHYIFADKNVEPVFEVNFLNGVETPFLDERDEFDVDGTRWKIRHDWGVAAIGYKGIQSNPGV